MKVKNSKLRSLIKQSLLPKYSDKYSEMITDVIMFGELSGKKSHGIVRLMIGKSSMLAQNPKANPRIVEKTRLSKLIEGNGNPAMLVGSIAMKEVIKIAEKQGFGLVGTRGTYSTSGCLSYYLEKIALSGLIGIIMARAPSDVSAFNSKEALFGTNPIGFAVPSKAQSLIFDMATSAISYGALLKANTTGEKLPDNVALDSKGKITREPKEAMNGALLTFDKSYKSSGLAMMVEILSGILPGASYIDVNEDDDWGNAFLAFQPDLLIDANEFNNRVLNFTKRLKKAKSRDGKKIRITGESTLETRDKSLISGYVEVDQELMNKLEKLPK